MNHLNLNEKKREPSPEREQIKALLKPLTPDPLFLEIQADKDGSPRVVPVKANPNLLDGAKSLFRKGNKIEVLVNALKDRLSHPPKNRPMPGPSGPNPQMPDKSPLQSAKYEVTGREKILAVATLPANMLLSGAIGAVLGPFVAPYMRAFTGRGYKPEEILLIPVESVAGAAIGSVGCALIAAEDTMKVLKGEKKIQGSYLYFAILPDKVGQYFDDRKKQ